jgi:G3E family GTPase
MGELEFSKQLRDILRNYKPAKMLIEPSGAGHAADIVDTLGVYEAQHALRLDSVVCLVDALDADRISRRAPNGPPRTGREPSGGRKLRADLSSPQ